MKMLSMLLLLPAFAAAEECLPLDTGQSEIRFEILQDDLPFSGNFTRFGGEVCFDHGAMSRIDAWMEPASVDTGLPELDAALADEAFFHASRFPRARFTSDSVTDTSGEHVAKGTLILKGTSRRQEIAFRLSKEGSGYRANGSLRIKRLDFNLGTGEWADTDLLGNEVIVHFDVGTR
ncbi:MAG: YceI family protein [Proteobacteria bacterium]|nr:YceI family protein [Pseudomonadota bacterium]